MNDAPIWVTILLSSVSASALTGFVNWWLFRAKARADDYQAHLTATLKLKQEIAAEYLLVQEGLLLTASTVRAQSLVFLDNPLRPMINKQLMLEFSERLDDLNRIIAKSRLFFGPNVTAHMQVTESMLQRLYWSLRIVSDAYQHDSANALHSKEVIDARKAIKDELLPRHGPDIIKFLRQELLHPQQVRQQESLVFRNRSLMQKVFRR